MDANSSGVTKRRKPYTVLELQNLNYYFLPVAEKIKIRECGPERPNFNPKWSVALNGSRTKKKGPLELYEKFHWLCGCSFRRALYCFPCLLMDVPLRDIRIAACLESAKSHEQFDFHVLSCAELALVGIVPTALKAHRTRDIEKVRRNRQILFQIITGFVEYADVYQHNFKTKPPLPHQESLTIFECLYRMDKTLKERYEYSPVFKKIQPQILGDQILAIVTSSYQGIVLKEVKNAKYIALITEEYTEFGTCDQIGMILRYVLDYQVVERFWTYIKPPHRTSLAVAEHILKELQTILPADREKLISQSHIGGAIYSRHIPEIQKKITEVYKCATYVHYHGYKFNLILERALSSISHVRNFFEDIYRIYNCLVKNRKFLHINYHEALHKGALTFLHDHRNATITFLVGLNSNPLCPPQFARETIQDRKNLEDIHFRTILTCAKLFLADANTMYEELINSCADSKSIAQSVNVFLKKMRKVRDDFNVDGCDVGSSEDAQIDVEAVSNQQAQSLQCELTKIDMCDIIIKEVEQRFHYTRHWDAHILLRADQYRKFYNNLPDNLQDTIMHFEPTYANKLQLELETIYTQRELNCFHNAYELLYAFHMCKLKDVFEKTTNLLYIVLTMPTMFDSEESKVSAAQRVRHAAELFADSELNISLTILLSEREALKSFPNFAERVMDVYIKKEGKEYDFNL